MELIACNSRAGGAGGDQLAGTYLPSDLPNPPIYNKVNPADRRFLRWR